MIFTFGPGGDSYYFNNGQQACWRNIPSQLVDLLRKDSRFETHKVTDLSLFPHDGYLLSAAGGSWASHNVPNAIGTRIEAIGSFEHLLSHVDTDSSDSSRYTFLAKDAKGRNKLVHNSLSPALLSVATSEMFNAFKSVVIGYNDTWLLQTSDDLVYVQLHNDYIHQLVVGKPLANVYLSPYSDQHAFIEYQDKTTVYLLPNTWHESIDAIRSKSPANHHHSNISAIFGKEFSKSFGEEAGKAMVGAVFQGV